MVVACCTIRFWEKNLGCQPWLWVWPWESSHPAGTSRLSWRDIPQLQSRCVHTFTKKTWMYTCVHDAYRHVFLLTHTYGEVSFPWNKPAIGDPPMSIDLQHLQVLFSQVLLEIGQGRELRSAQELLGMPRRTDWCLVFVILMFLFFVLTFIIFDFLLGFWMEGKQLSKADHEVPPWWSQGRFHMGMYTVLWHEPAKFLASVPSYARCGYSSRFDFSVGCCNQWTNCENTSNNFALSGRFGSLSRSKFMEQHQLLEPREVSRCYESVSLLVGLLTSWC